MAFKSKATPNVGTSPLAVTETVGAGTTATLIGLSIANKTAANITASALLNKSGGTTAFLVKDATILPGGALVVVGGDQKVVLEAGDSITAYTSAANSADAVASYLA